MEDIQSNESETWRSSGVLYLILKIDYQSDMMDVQSENTLIIWQD